MVRCCLLLNYHLVLMLLFTVHASDIRLTVYRIFAIRHIGHYLIYFWMSPADKFSNCSNKSALQTPQHFELEWLHIFVGNYSQRTSI